MPTFVSEATTAPGAATATAATLPTGWAVGDRCFLAVCGKPTTAGTNFTTPTVTGWTLVNRVDGGASPASGTDTGPMSIVVYERTMQSGDANPTVTPGATAPNSWNFITSAWRLVGTADWEYADGSTPFQSAVDTTTASPLTATTGSLSPQPTDGDALLCFGTVPTDAGTALGTTTITCTGLSGGTVAAGQYVENTLGTDSAAVSGRWTGFTGTGSAGVAISFTVTSATNQNGSVVALLVADVSRVDKIRFPPMRQAVNRAATY